MGSAGAASPSHRAGEREAGRRGETLPSPDLATTTFATSGNTPLGRATSDRQANMNGTVNGTLDELRAQVVSMGGEVGMMLADAVGTLVGGYTPGVAGAIMERDNAVDACHATIEARCLRFLSSGGQQAGDLRRVTALLQTAGDLERIGDHAVNIARTAQRMSDEGVWYRPLVDTARLGDMARQMVRDALRATVTCDRDLAEAVVRADDAVDSLYARMRGDLQAAMEREASVVRLGASLLFVIHYLERVADHATNIAERV